ncbi:MAG: 3-oxoacyl-ACP reductase FabG [Burkholderiales bacterium]|nr:3-oxoacyl-ACP reductase FabG [Burkholderiales bacterium]
MLNGKVALVTGASRGIGQAIALELAAAGAKVAGTATTQGGADGITAAIEAAGGTGAGFVLDVNDAARCEAVLDEIAQRFGDVAILVNNAGITADNLLMRMKDEEWDRIMAINLRPVYVLSKLVMRPMMKARWGRIINVTSVVGYSGNAGQTNYAAAKAGMVGFSKSLAREVGSRNITVNCIAPGFIDTDMTKSLAETQKQALLTQVPLGRFGTVKEIAAAAVFLASDGAGYITGSTIHVNGGMFMD